MRLLHIDSSPKKGLSNSRRLSRFSVEKLAANNPDLNVDYLDLIEASPPHIDGDFASAINKAPSERTEDMNRH